MRGLPASGKSTKAEEILTQGNTVRLNKDLLRTMLHFDKFTGRNEGLTRDASRMLAKTFLARNTNVIIDDTNLNDGTMQSWKDLAKECDAKIEHYNIETPVEECLKRDAQREKQVGATVIKQMALQYCDYMKGEKIVVCDIDGTIANLDHRLQYGKGETKDWDKFFSLIMSDTLIWETVVKVREKLSETGARLIFVSARPDKYRTFTMDWLFAKLLGSGLETKFEMLLMRPSNDKRQDTEVKSDIYEKYLKNLDIVAVFDDRPSVIRMWREKGLDVIDVGKGQEF